MRVVAAGVVVGVMMVVYGEGDGCRGTYMFLA